MDNPAQIFTIRAIELIKEAQKIRDEKELQVKLGQLEGFMTGVLEIFTLAEKDEKKV